MKDLLHLQQKLNFAKDEWQITRSLPEKTETNGVRFVGVCYSEQWNPHLFTCIHILCHLPDLFRRSHTDNSNGNNNYLFINITNETHKHQAHQAHTKWLPQSERDNNSKTKWRETSAQIFMKDHK